MKNNTKSILSNFIWRLLERTGAQLVNLLVSVILARILSPTEYGMVALINVFINILLVFIDSGFGTALIQKKHVDELDYSSVFYFQVFLCIITYIVLFFVSPTISTYYKNEQMTPMIRVLGLTLIVAGIKNIQIAYVSRHMMFKKFFFATLGGTLGAAVLGIALAAAGFGAWAIIAQSLFNNTVDTVILWITVGWRPKRVFSKDRIKRLMPYSWKLLVSGLLDTGYTNLRSLIIGKMYTAEDLAYFDQGKKWPEFVVVNVDSSIDSVLLPTMSSQQDDKMSVKAMTRSAIKTSTYVMAPILIGIAFCGESLIKLLLTEKWLPAVPYLVIFCITFMFYPVHTANLNAIKAMGRSDLFLRLEIEKKAIGIALLAITIPISVKAMAYSLLVSSITSQIINSWPNRKLIDYPYSEQLKDVMPGISLAIIMGIVVYWFKLLPINELYILILQVITGALIYVGISMLLKFEAFSIIYNTFKDMSRARKRNHKDQQSVE